jgi:hypothetical protein
MKHILSSAVITGPGTYEYMLITVEQAQAWIDEGGWVSTIGYPETAEALSRITGCRVPWKRETIRMDVGDEALVFRLVLPPARIDQGAKGRLGLDHIRNHCECGILRRTA